MSTRVDLLNQALGTSMAPPSGSKKLFGFLLSPVGQGLVLFLISFVILLITSPPFIEQRSKDGLYRKKSLWKVFLVSLVFGSLPVLVPWILVMFRKSRE